MTPYRDELFRELAALNKHQLNVIMLSNRDSDHEWSRSASDDYGHQVVRPGPLALRLIWALHKLRPHTVVFGGYESIGAMFTAWTRRALGKHYLIWSGTTGETVRRTQPIVRAYRRLAFTLAEHTLAYSSKAAEFAIRSGARNVTIIGNAATSMPAPARSYDRGATPPDILYVGRLVPYKGAHMLPAILRKASQALDRQLTIEIIGVGSEEGWLRRHLPSGTRFRGFGTPTAIADAMARCSCMVVPSMHEVWGLVVNEALSLGTPVVGSTTLGCVPDLLDSATGFVAPPTVDDLANAIIECLTRPDISTTRQLQGIARSRQYSGLNVARRIATILDDAS